MQAIQAAQAFFDGFVQDFARFSGELIARRYACPYLAMHADGTNDLYQSADDTARCFQQVVDAYRAQGARACRYGELDVVAVGSSHLFATVTWELQDHTGARISASRESYTLELRGGEYRIVTSIDHSPQ